MEIVEKDCNGNNLLLDAISAKHIAEEYVC